MGSTETDSTEQLHKLVIEENLYMACAGDMALCSDVGSIIKQNLGAVPKRTHGNIWGALNKAVHETLTARFQWDVLVPKYMFAQGMVFENQRENITEEWQRYNPNLEMLIGTFHESGVALLYLISRNYNGSAWVHACQYPGHVSIGTGAYNATFWLNFRGQQLGLSPKQSAYHAYEAKGMAATAPTVNTNVDMVIASADRHYLLASDNPAPTGSPVSLDELRTMYKKYGPQNTDDLGHKTKEPSTKTSTKK